MDSVSSLPAGTLLDSLIFTLLSLEGEKHMDARAGPDVDSGL